MRPNVSFCFWNWIWYTFARPSLPGECFYNGRSGDRHVGSTFHTLHTGALSPLHKNMLQDLSDMHFDALLKYMLISHEKEEASHMESLIVK